MKKEQNIFKQLGASISNLFKRLFGMKQDDFITSEELMSPKEMIAKNFFRNKLAVTGLIVFIIMATVTVGGSMLFPVNFNDSKPALSHTAPGRNHLKVPSALQKEGVKSVSSGVSYSFGVSESGKTYFWGVATERVDEIPEEVKNGKVAQIASGDRHAISLLEDGKLVAWGLNSFDQGSIPTIVSTSILKDGGAKKVFAGDLYSGVISNKGKAYVWGSTLNSKLDMVPKAIQGEIVDVSTSSNNLIFLLKDGTLVINGSKGRPIQANLPENLTDGSVNVVKVVSTNENGLALDDKGNLHIWGTTSSAIGQIPEGLDTNIKDIASGKDHFTVLKADGTVEAWGSMSHDQANSAALSGGKFDAIESNYYQTYAFNDGKIEGFGFKGFLLGSDDWGRDIAIRLIHGGRITMFIGVIAVFISTIIGVTVGLIAGFYGGRVDNVLMRIAEIVSSFPFLPLAITLSTLLAGYLSQSQRLFMVMIILGIISWPGLARMIRGQILAEREKDFVLAARALGLPTGKILMKHILPAVFNIIIVTMTLSYAGNLLTESGLSFLGFGVMAPEPSWGNMLSSSQSAKVIEFYWWEWVLPALCVLMAALSVNLVGDGLREAMDPRANEK